MGSLSTPALAAIVTALSLVLTPLVAYITVSRRLSGKIQTSEAADLWKESAAMREDYRGRLKDAMDHIESLEASNSTLRDELAEVKWKMSDLIIENNGLRRKVEELEGKPDA